MYKIIVCINKQNKEVFGYVEPGNKDQFSALTCFINSQLNDNDIMVVTDNIESRSKADMMLQCQLALVILSFEEVDA